MIRQLETARTPDEQDRFPRMMAIHSPQSWGHFNLLGEYDFSGEKLQDNSGVLLLNLPTGSFRKTGNHQPAEREGTPERYETGSAVDHVPLLGQGRTC